MGIILVFIFAVHCILLSPIINSKTAVYAQTHEGYSPPATTVSATVGRPMLNIWGYAPSDSTVSVTGIRVSASTRADDRGYYEFYNVALPVAETPEEEHFVEVCLMATDTTGATTQPTCIPPIDTSGLEYTVGPVNLSPTLTLEASVFYKGDQINASGYTTPETEIEVYLAREKTGTSFFDIIREVSAYYIPTYHTKSDNTGYFEFNLPADSKDDWRIFTASKVMEANSPISNTLSFSIKSPLYTIIEALFFVFKLIFPYRYYLLILIQVTIILLLLSKYRRRKTKTYLPTQKK